MRMLVIRIKLRQYSIQVVDKIKLEANPEPEMDCSVPVRLYLQTIQVVWETQSKQAGSRTWPTEGHPQPVLG